MHKLYGLVCMALMVVLGFSAAGSEMLVGAVASGVWPE